MCVFLGRPSTTLRDQVIISDFRELHDNGAIHVSANPSKTGYFYPVLRSNAPALFLISGNSSQS
jgi:hypothetical protein